MNSPRVLKKTWGLIPVPGNLASSLKPIDSALRKLRFFAQADTLLNFASSLKHILCFFASLRKPGAWHVHSACLLLCACRVPASTAPTLEG